MHNPLLNIHEEVLKAMANGQPIVALESTIISHGMPWPDNLKTALEVEAIIRDTGAIPATIALHEGYIQIGLNQKTMEYLARHHAVHKASRRDIAYILSKKLSASTTVAATMYCAHLSHIPLFVTGGIGGVHHMAEVHFDISADLIELSSTPVTVVCAGAKSILDLPKTLEVLETHGVPVVGYQTDEFPAFYSRTSGITLQHRLETPEEIASLMHYQKRLNLRNGIVVANPIPQDAALSELELAPLIQKAQQESKSIQGQALTPYLLKRITELTEGKSLIANIELIKNNAKLGAEIAIAYKK